jgi:predicted nuclease with RNAse H fold
MRYCGVVPLGEEHLQLGTLEEVREPEPPIRLRAELYQPGSPADVAGRVSSFDEVVLAVGAPLGDTAHGRPERVCDELLRGRGLPPAAPSEAVRALRHGLRALAGFSPETETLTGAVDEGAFHAGPLFETNADAVFAALQGHRLPARRHPWGVHLRIAELRDDHVEDSGGELWHRRIEELDALACALCAHRYAVGHACWLGDPAEGVIVLPGTSVPERFATEGVLPPVERLPLSNG